MATVQEGKRASPRFMSMLFVTYGKCCAIFDHHQTRKGDDDIVVVEIVMV